jgi:hypothetical protein
MGPGAQLGGAKVRQPAADFLLARTIAGEEYLPGFGMGEIESAAPGEQELARHRGHGVEHGDFGTAPGQDFGRHQAGRAAADHGDGPAPLFSADHARPGGWQDARSR